MSDVKNFEEHFDAALGCITSPFKEMETKKGALLVIIDHAAKAYVALGGDPVGLTSAINCHLEDSKRKHGPVSFNEMVEQTILGQPLVMAKNFCDTYPEHDIQRVFPVAMRHAVRGVIRMVKMNTTGGWGAVRKVFLDSMEELKGVN